MSRLITLLLALSLGVGGFVAACGGHEQSSVTAADDDGGSADRDGAAALPPGVDHYHGNVACCAQDAGLCCDDGPVLTCETYVACVQSGEAWVPKGLACQDCCPGLGLTHLEITTANADGTCTPSGDGFEPSFVCSPCGDGRCDAENGENRCNCPADCP
jgi:hypothetical protein